LPSPAFIEELLQKSPDALHLWSEPVLVVLQGSVQFDERLLEILNRSTTVATIAHFFQFRIPDAHYSVLFFDGYT
jgi:hypothetical protein